MSSTLPVFSWGLGIEDTFIPQTRPGLRPLDEYELTAHYRLWREDFDNLGEVGAQHVRWGIPWYRVNPAPNVYDWSWIDEALDHLVNNVGCIPIIDLMHYGTPLWLDNAFINSSYPERVAEYAHTFAERYRDLVRYYTPLNEPMVNALYCGKLGQWPPHLVGDDGYVNVLMSVCRGVVLTEKALRAANADTVIVQVEAVEFHHSADNRLSDRVATEQAQIFLPFDLFTGRVDTEHLLWPFLQSHGIREADLHWYQEQAIDVDIFGVNYYPVSGGVWTLGKDEEATFTRGVTSEQLGDVLKMVWDRYQLPMMLTETAVVGHISERIRWMDESVAQVRQAMDLGIPVVGYTWWPLFDMIEWDYRFENAPLFRYSMPVGLWKNKFADSENLNMWEIAGDQWGSRYAGLDKLTRERTPLADHFHTYALGNS
ncbi:MAG: glycoside hydrolase family 1 protein [Caldilineaceae bacterium]|nr:glycoside hydrolase family 1 protein [Caldilineaceae bacterium]